MIIISLKDLEVGKNYTAVGTSGMHDGKEVEGIMLSKTIGSDPILQVKKNVLCSVNKNTMKLKK